MRLAPGFGGGGSRAGLLEVKFFVGLVLAAMVVLVGCSSGSSASDRTASSARTATSASGSDARSDAAAQPSPGCANSSQPASGLTKQTISVGGAQRTYRRYLPGAAHAGPLPVVINIHGLTSSADQQAAITAFEPLGEREGFIVLSPEGGGAPSHFDIGARADNPDVVFIRSMLDEVGAATCVDMARVYATGLSDGGIMSSVLACFLSDRIAAVGVVSGIQHAAGCEPSHPMPMMVFWGKDDRILPFCGGVGPFVLALITNSPIPTPAPPQCPPANFLGFPPVEQVVTEWADTDDCNPEPAVSNAGVNVELRAFSGCGGDATIQVYVVADGGHSWPGSKVMQALSATSAAAIIGQTTDAVDATELIWAFFRQHALTAQ